MGEVYLAQDTTLSRLVAIKLLPADFTADRDRLHRFEREAYAASSLNHPNILTIHEIGDQTGHHFIATEFIEGESLRQHMARSHLTLRKAQCRAGDNT
jgi:serine/threonine protein kinase